MGWLQALREEKSKQDKKSARATLDSTAAGLVCWYRLAFASDTTLIVIAITNMLP